MFEMLCLQWGKVVDIRIDSANRSLSPKGQATLHTSRDNLPCVGAGVNSPLGVVGPNFNLRVGARSRGRVSACRLFFFLIAINWSSYRPGDMFD